MRPLLLSLLLAATLGDATADMAPPGTPVSPPPSISDQVAQADAIVYGRAVRIQSESINAAGIRYDATFRIERCWKGDLTGDIRTEGGRSFGCYTDAPFGIEQSYLVFLKKEAEREAYSPVEIHDLRLPLASPSPKESSLFSPSPPPPGTMAILEHLERRAGNHAEADRLHALIEVWFEKPRREHELAEKNASAFLVSAKDMLKQAFETANLDERKNRLLALQKQLEQRDDEPSRDIKRQIDADMSVIATLQANGRRKMPGVPE